MSGELIIDGVRIDDTSDAPDCIPAVLRLNGDLQQVTRHRVGHHHRFAIDPSDPVGSEGHRGNLNQRHASSTHERSQASQFGRSQVPRAVLWLIVCVDKGGTSSVRAVNNL